MTTISHRGTVRTTSPMVAFYFRYVRRHRVNSLWYKPTFFVGPMAIYTPRWELRPA